MDYILHIDTATDSSTVAISRNGALLNYVVNDEIRNHAGTINNMIADVLGKTEIFMSDLCAISVCSGPGSYTGLRISMATAKGIGYAIDKPLIMNDRLSILAYHAIQNNIHNSRHVATIITAREKEYFISIYNNDFICEVAPTHIAENDLYELLHGKENLHIITDAPEALFYKLKVSFSSFNPNIKLDTNSWIACAYEQYNSNGIVNISTAVPLYLKQVYTHK